jgi:hypothetical protein
MRKHLLEFNFDDCITESPLEITRDLLVIYPVDKDNSFLNSDDFAYDYVESANLIVDTMYLVYSKESKDIFFDKFALPVLNLYINVVEFALKMLIKALVNHRNKKCCQLINDPPVDYEKKLKTHELASLADICCAMVSTNGHIHSFQDFYEFADFIKSLEKYGIDSMSTRYQVNKIGAPYELHSLRQSWLNPIEVVEKIVNKDT